ncbi:MAG: FAD-dependent monooxygenase [Phycisphaerae bacterium]|nr:FAD-dependent monooxygenase [Phycisphaerae bacterium]
MRILTAGAGIGGLTLAALLEARGVRLRIVERAPNFEHAGYSLGLYPLGTRVLHGLGLYQALADVSVETSCYEVHDDRGRLLKRWSLDPIAGRFGAILGTTRPNLVRVLRKGLRETEIEFDTALEGLEGLNGGVRATFSDGSSDEFDLVVGADGLNSRARAVMFGEPSRFDTGWGGWMWWADKASIPKGAFVEYWGSGRFLGVYPAVDKVCVFAGAPRAGGFGQAGAGREQRVRARFTGLGATTDELLEAIPRDDATMYFWPMADARSATWVRDRVVLLGDAAAGFLPTAGVGASMAMESAAVLNDELSRASRATLDEALSLYVKRRKDRVRRIQRDSRKLSRMMFLSSRPIARLRDFVVRFYSTEMLAKNIAQAFDEPI